MKRAMVIGLIVVMALAMGSVSALAASPTPQEVKDLVTKAVQYIVEQGPEKAFKDLTDPKGEWVNGELYVFIYDLNGTIAAHLNQKLVGKNLMKVKDVKGNVFAAEFVRIAKSPSGEGWCEYWWPKPGEKKASPKASYIKKVPGKDFLVGVGVYDLTKEAAEKATGK